MATITIDNIPNKDISLLKRLAKRMGWTIEEDKEKDFDAETWAAIERARKNFAEGKCVSCKTPEELDNFFNSL